jgi:rhodanese-related sulfurtransferase
LRLYTSEQTGEALFKTFRAFVSVERTLSGFVVIWLSAIVEFYGNLLFNRLRSHTCCLLPPSGELMKAGWVLLDVRPPNEVEKVPIAGAVAVPLFVADPANDPGTLLKKAATFGTGGWWLGGSHMIPNQNFLQEVDGEGVVWGWGTLKGERVLE